MVYVALLRGINVGGNHRVEMHRLKKSFEQLGFEKVKTYINSGNVIFVAPKQPLKLYAGKIEKDIEEKFGFRVDVIVRDYTGIQAVATAILPEWENNQNMRCDVLFLWDEIDSEDVLKLLKFRPEIEDVKYAPGAIIWRIDREFVTRSSLIKIIGTPLYKQMTIRNCNTVRRLYSMMTETNKI